MSIVFSSHDVDADEDDYKKTKQVDERDNGRIDVYTATDGDFSSGHGHETYNSMDDYIDAQDSLCAGESGNSDGKTWEGRGPNDEDSQNRSWKDKETGESFNDEREM